MKNPISAEEFQLCLGFHLLSARAVCEQLIILHVPVPTTSP